MRKFKPVQPHLMDSIRTQFLLFEHKLTTQILGVKFLLLVKNFCQTTSIDPESIFFNSFILSSINDSVPL